MMPHATVPRAKWPIHPNGRGKVMPVSRSATYTISSIGLSCGIKPTELLAIIKIERTTVATKPAISPAWTFRVTGIACKNCLRFMAFLHELKNLPRVRKDSEPSRFWIRSPAGGTTAAIDFAETRHVPLAALGSIYTNCVSECRGAMSPIGPTRTSGEVRYRAAMRGTADHTRPDPRRRVYEYTPFCNAPGDVKSPRVIVTPPSSRFCPWSALRPPHYAVRRNGEPT